MAQGWVAGIRRLWITDNEPIIAKLTVRVCNVLTEEQIRVEIPDWHGCEVELELAWVEV
jgi:hypothetical protein